MAALLVLRAVLALLMLRDGRGATGPAGGAEGSGPPDESDEAVRFLSGEAPGEPAAPPNPSPPAAPVRPPRRSLWPGWAKALAAAVPFSGVAVGVAAIALAVTRAMRPDAIPGALAADSTELALVLIALSILAVWILWRVPQWQAAAWAEQSNATPRERFEIENASRGTLGQILSGVAVLAGLIFAWQQLGSTTRSVQLSEQGQLTDRFTSAIGQLASDDLEVRLGGIYALEQIARDNPRDFAASMQVLAAIVRGDGRPEAAPTDGRLPRDVEVAMTVIGRRTPEQIDLQAEQGIPCLDLTGARLVGLTLQDGANLRGLCLGGTDLSQSRLVRADFTGSVMNGAVLQRAYLDGAVLAHDLARSDLSASLLAGAQLAGANLTDANLSSVQLVCSTTPGVEPACASLRGAALFGTNLSGANFLDADLADANFTQANLASASFFGTDLSTVVGLTPDQLAAAFVSPGTPLPPHFAPATPNPSGR